jgi:hypothetical protein
MILASVAAALSAVAVLQRQPQPEVSEEIDPDAMAAVDFAALEPAVADFLAKAQKNETIGRGVSDFPLLWAEALPPDADEASSRFQWKRFILAMTAELQNENDSRVLHGNQVLYWPMLWVRIDTKEAKIVRVGIFMQGL